jgi:uncharacterized protein (TIGR00369 family)
MSHLRPEFTAEAFNRFGKDYLPGYLGVEIVELGDSRLVARMEIKPVHFAPNNFLHAASIIALADTACGYATIAHLPEGAQSFTTIELKSNHLGTAREGAVYCVATPQHLGKTTQVWDAIVYEEAAQRKLALFRCTQMILWPRPESAKG